jgi:class 3 adenylate cyclase
VPRLRIKSLARPDEVRDLPGLLVESVGLGDVFVGRCTFQPGWRWSTDMGPLMGTATCPIYHLGYSVSGTMRVVMADGETADIRPHDVFEVPPSHDKWVVGDQPWVAIEWGGSTRAAEAARRETGTRELATVVFTDIADSTRTAHEVGDTAWRNLLAAHNTRLRGVLNVYRGREVATTGDGFLAVFDSATRAVRCAAEMLRAASGLGLTIRAGVHSGEIDAVGDDVRGLAVHVAARVTALAAPGEVLVSSTTGELLEGSGLELIDAGSHELKGLAGPRHLLRVMLTSLGADRRAVDEAATLSG